MDAHEHHVAVSAEDRALDAEIRQLLAVDPSAEFLTRVRQRITTQPVSRSYTRWVLGGAATAAAAALFVVGLRTVPPSPAPVSTPLPAVALSNAMRAWPAATHEPAEPTATPSSQAPVVRATADPEVLFDPRDRVAFLQLLAATRHNAIPPGALLVNGRSSSEPIAPIIDLAVPPLAVDRLNTGTY